MNKFIQLRKALIFAVIAAFCGGLVPPIAKIALEVFQPFTLVMLRFFFATLVLLPFVIKRHELNVKGFKELFSIAFIGSLNPILLFIALPFTKASVSPLIYAIVPSMTALYLYSFEKHKITKRQFMGILIGLIGVCLIVVLPLIESTQVDFDALKGNIFILFAAVAFMFYGLISKKKQKDLGISPLSLTFYFCLVTFILSFPFSINELIHSSHLLSQIEFRHILASVGVGVVGTSIFYLVYQNAIKIGNAFTAALFTYLQPVATISLSIILLGEHISIPFIIGGVLAIYGAQIASKK